MKNREIRKETCESLLKDINSSFVELTQKFDTLTAIARKKKEARLGIPSEKVAIPAVGVGRRVQFCEKRVRKPRGYKGLLG